MENEKSILDATEYILMAINNIQIKNHNNPKNIINNQWKVNSNH